MLLKLEKLIAKYGMKITGVIQAGAHEGEELELFKKLRIPEAHLFEPCYRSFLTLSYKTFPANYHVYRAGLAEVNGDAILFKTRFNNGQSNSLFAPKRHLDFYPDIIFDDHERVPVNTLDTFKVGNCNFLMMDVQGGEILVLKGATETLKHIDYIITEVNLEEMYEGCALIEDLDNYLTDFQRVETKLVRCKAWGDSLYIAKRLL